MRYIYKVALILLPVLVLALAGCGNSSSGSTATDPFSSTNTGTIGTTPVTAQDPAFSLTLDTDLIKPTDLTKLPQVDANIGTVLLTAKLLNVSGGVFIDTVTNQPIAPGAPLPNQAVSFNILAGPGTISFSTPVTDKNGESKAVLTTGNVSYTTNVIVEASTTVDGKIYRAYTQFQIVRGTGTITLSNEQKLEFNLPASYPIGAPFYILHQFSFLLTDSNGNPRVGEPVTLSVHSSIPPTPVFLDYTTIKTGSDGKGWFNARITLFAPGPGLPDSASIIYKARTNDQYPIINYKGSVYTIIQEPLSSAK